MPIFAYVGRPRSGKSYEVVSFVILGALRDGRRVVSNIAGLNFEAMRDLLLAEGVPVDQIGELVTVTHEEVEKPGFWRTDKDEAAGYEAYVKPGDLVALDEIWRFWKKRGDIPDRAMNFCRMHGHFTHPKTGFCCQLALITQSIRDINENVRDVVEQTFRMTKLTAVGADNRYRVDVYQGGSVSNASFLHSLPTREYNPKYFPLYTSHSQRKAGSAEANEQILDDRGNILRGRLFRVVLPVAFVALILAVWFLWRFLHPSAPKDKPAADKTELAAAAAKPSKPPPPELSDSWRVVGYYMVGGSMRVMLSGPSGVRYLVDPPNLKRIGLDFAVELPEGGYATHYTGSAHGSRLASLGGDK